MITTPNDRLEALDGIATLDFPLITGRVDLRQKRRTLQDCSCESETDWKCDCNPQCTCDSECKHCVCVDDCRGFNCRCDGICTCEYDDGCNCNYNFWEPHR